MCPELQLPKLTSSGLPLVDPLRNEGWINRELGFECPKPLERIIANSGKSAEKLASIKKSFQKLFTAVGEDKKDYALVALSSETLSERFAKDDRWVIDRFSYLSRTFSCPLIFNIIGNECVAEVYLKNPVKIERAFNDIQEFGGDNAGWFFSILKRPEIASAFTREPDRTVDSIREAWKIFDDDVAWALVGAIPTSDKLSGLFAEKPDIVIRIFKKINSNPDSNLNGRIEGLVHPLTEDHVLEFIEKNEGLFFQIVDLCPAATLDWLEKLLNEGVQDSETLLHFASMIGNLTPRCQRAGDDAFTEFIGNKNLWPKELEKLEGIFQKINMQLSWPASEVVFSLLPKKIARATDNSVFGDFEKRYITEDFANTVGDLKGLLPYKEYVFAVVEKYDADVNFSLDNSKRIGAMFGRIGRELDGEAIKRVLITLYERMPDILDSVFFDKFETTIIFEEVLMKKFTDKYGIRPIRASGFFDMKQGAFDTEASGISLEQRVHDKIFSIAKKINISPNFLAAALLQEGFIGIMMNPATADKPYSIDSFSTLGMDAFLAEIDSMKKSNYLPKGFGENNEYGYYYKATNEAGFESTQVHFRDVDTAIEAFGALLALRRDRFVRAINDRGYKLNEVSEETLWAGVYLFYNAANPEKKLDGIGIKRLLDKYNANLFSYDRINKVKYNYLRVVSTADYLRESGVFSKD